MMVVVADVVQQLYEKNSSAMQLVLEKILQQQAKITKAFKQIPSNVGGIDDGGGKSTK